MNTNILIKIDQIKKTFKNVVEIESCKIKKSAIISDKVYGDAVNKLGFELPEVLKYIYIHEAGGINFSWNLSSSIFGQNCQRGIFHLMNVTDVVWQFRENQAMVDEAKLDNLDSEDGYKAIVTDWPFWIPIFRFPSGDCFCLDVRSESNELPVVFLEHDVMDSGPNLHGLKIASNLEELIHKWFSVAFVDLYDWTLGVNTNGINLDADVFTPLRDFLDKH